MKKEFKSKILAAVSLITCACMAIAGLNLDLGKLVRAQNSVQMLSGGIDSTQNLFEKATFSDANYIYNQYAPSGTLGGYIKKGVKQTVNGYSQLPVVIDTTTDAVSYAGAKLTLSGTTTLDMGVVDLSKSQAEDTNAVIGFLPTVNYAGPQHASEVVNPYLGIYYTFRSTVNPDKYFDIAMRETNAANWKYPSVGVAFNGKDLHYGQTVNPENSSIPAGRTYVYEENSRIGGYSYRFNGSIITSSMSAASTSHGRVYAEKLMPNGNYDDIECTYNYPMKVFYDYETSKFYVDSMEYQVRKKMNNERDKYVVVAEDDTERYLLADISRPIGSYSDGSKYNSKYGWTGFTEEEAKSVAVTMHVDWNPEYTGSHDIVITDFAGQQVNTTNADTLKANKGTSGALKEFTSRNGGATLTNGYKVNLSDNDIFTKLVSFEVYPEQMGTTKATNNSGLHEVSFTLSDGTNNLKINFKDFDEGGTYRNCVTVSVNGESKWAQNQSGEFKQNTEYGYPLPYHFDRYVRHTEAYWVLDQYSVDDDEGETQKSYSHYGMRVDANISSQATINIYYNAADNCLYADTGKWNSSLYTSHTNAEGITVKRWKIADLSSTYGGARTAFAGFGDNDLSFSMATTLVNGFDSAKIRILEVDGQKLATDKDGKSSLEFNATLANFESGARGKVYNFVTPDEVSAMGDYELSVVAPSGQIIDIVNDRFTPEETGEYQVIYMVDSKKFTSKLRIYESIVDTDALAGNFSKIGPNVDYIKDISYGEFTNTNFSGGGLMVTTRNKESQYASITDNSNSTNPWLINYDTGRYPVGVSFNGAIDVSDNTASDTLIELAFPPLSTSSNTKYMQARAYEIIIADASNPDKYIAVFLWDTLLNGASTSSGYDTRITAGASWETSNGYDVYSTDTGYDDGSTYTSVGDIAYWETSAGLRDANIRFAIDSKSTAKIQFDNATGKLYVNGQLIRSFKDVSKNGTYFDGFTNDEVKISVGVVRSNKHSTDEFTRFCIMSLDGVSLLAQDGKIWDTNLGLDNQMSLTDSTTGDVFYFDANQVVNVAELFSTATSKVIGYYDGDSFLNINDLNNVQIIENKTYQLVYLDFYTENGAAVRFGSYTGLRFKGYMDSNIDAEIASKIVEFGMILAPTDYIENKDFTLDNYKDGSMYKQVATEYVTEGDSKLFYVTMTKIRAANLAREFSARVYVEIAYDDGSTAYVYSSYDQTANSRSAYEVAQAAYNDATAYEGMTEEETTAAKNFLRANYIDKVVEINTIGVKSNDDATYMVDAVSKSNDGSILYLTVSGANGARCLVYDGATYFVKDTATVPTEENPLVMYEENGKLNVAFLLPQRSRNAAAQAVTLFEDGVTAYSILVPENATQSENFAATELQTIIYNSYGVEMPIVSYYDNSTSKYISLGNTQFKKNANVILSAYAQSQGGFAIKSYEEGVAIYSEDDYALFYGLYRFLEENFGYKYYAYDCTVIDTNSVQTLKDFEYEDFPDFKYRSLYSELTRVGYRTGDTDTSEMTEEMKAAYINMHLYNTGSAYQIIDSNGYSSGNYGKNIPPFSYELDDQSLLTYFLPYDSSWDYYYTGKTYGSTYPNWYYKQDGVVKQICFTKAYNNDNGMYNIILDKLTWVISNNSTKTFFEIGIGDNSSKCECTECKAGYNTYGASGVYLRFVNKLANDVKVWQAKNCPFRDIYLMAYAYQAFIEAPKGGVVAADNVMIRIAPITLDYSKAVNASNNYYDDSWLNRIKWSTIFEGWTKAAIHLGIWDYRADFRHYLQPLPLQKSTEANIEYFKSIGVTEIYSQGIGGSKKIAIYPFAEMDDWIRCRMYWDTTLSYNDLRDEFVNAYYGDAATYVLQYISKIESAFGSTEFDLGEDLTVTELKRRYSSSWVSEVETLFTQAYSAVGDDADLVKRLDYLSMFYRYLQIKCSYTGADKATFKTMCDALGIWKVEINLTVEDFTA